MDRREFLSKTASTATLMAVPTDPASPVAEPVPKAPAPVQMMDEFLCRANPKFIVSWKDFMESLAVTGPIYYAGTIWTAMEGGMIERHRVAYDRAKEPFTGRPALVPVAETDEELAKRHGARLAVSTPIPPPYSVDVARKPRKGSEATITAMVYAEFSFPKGFREDRDAMGSSRV